MKPILSPFLEKIRLEKVKPYLKGAILDLGCGYASLVRYLPGDSTYIGVDEAAGTIDRLRMKYLEHTFFRCNLEQDPIPVIDKCDTIVLCAILEHLKNPAHIFSEIQRLLSMQGHLVITTPTPAGDFLHKVGAGLGLFAREADEDHEIIYNRVMLIALLEENNFILRKYQRFMLGGNQLVVADRRNG
jgi:SAM-dependent methyltransferase